MQTLGATRESPIFATALYLLLLASRGEQQLKHGNCLRTYSNWRRLAGVTLKFSMAMDVIGKYGERSSLKN
jgi:hypothetical protein